MSASETSPLKTGTPLPAPEPTAALAGPTPGGSGSSVDLELRVGGRPVPEYELVEKLGEGGFGQVWKARDAEGFETALKFLRLDERTGVTELRSLEVMKNIRHPHLLSIFRVWRLGKHLVIAMELADTTLYQRLIDAEATGGSGVPRPELTEYMREIAKGLDHLHSLGVQHRDVKPQNFLLCGGSVKVADFGLAKVLEAGLASNSGAMTPAYAAPEFFQGKTDPNSDQYSLAVTYCQLRGGKLPFAGSPTEMLYGHLHGEPDLSMLSEAEKPAIARALSKKGVDRWPSCKSFVEALAIALDDTIVVSTSARVGLGPEAPPTLLPPATVVPGAASTAKQPARRGLSWVAAFGSAIALGALLAGVALLYLPTRPSAGKDGSADASRPQVSPDPPTAKAPPESKDGALNKDSRPVPPPPPAKSASLKLRPLLPIALRPGQAVQLTAVVDRVELPGVVTLELQNVPEGVAAAATTIIPAGKNEAAIELKAGADAVPVVADLVVIARAGDLRSEAKVRFELTKPAVLAKEITNALGMKLVLIPAGKFRMGSPDSEEGSKDDETPHEVTLTKPYYIGQHEVTRGQFRAFVDAAGYRTEAEKDGTGCWGYDALALAFVGPKPAYSWKTVGFDQEDTHPVVNITWRDARAFCDWLGKKEGKKYALPTEAEWEYACRAGTTTPFCNGTDPLAIVKVGNVADRSLRGRLKGVDVLDANDGYAFTSPIAKFGPNAWGLHDVHGNAWEWCADWYDVDYYGKSDKSDPQGPKEGIERVLRGGSWTNVPTFCRSACRAQSAPTYRHPTIGFRVVMMGE